jgi:hypothetical protein
MFAIARLHANRDGGARLRPGRECAPLGVSAG